MPLRCSHAYGMLWDDDYACCKLCEYEWKFIPNRGWMPLSMVTERPVRKGYESRKPKRPRR